MKAAPKTGKGRRTRGRIVTEAAKLVRARGVRETSVDDVLAAAGVSKSQIYHYFDDKADLMRAVVSQTAAGVIGGQQPLLDRLDSWDGIRKWFDALVANQIELHARGGCPIGSLVPQLAEADESARGELTRSFDAWQGPLADALRIMRERRELLAEADPDALAVATMASLQGGLLLTQARRDPAQLRIALDAALAHLRAHELPSRRRRS